MDARAVRVAAAAYPLDPVESWDEWEAKANAWVAAGEADLLVFPEYAAMELAHLDGAAVAGDLHASLRAAARHGPRAQTVWATLARMHRCHVLTPSGPWEAGGRIVNRAHLHGPDGPLGRVDKQVMTPFERDWGIAPGDPLHAALIGGLRVGVCICYDAEFPALTAALRPDLLLVPSCTDAVSGWSRVRVAAQARALEWQCVVAQSPSVGDCPWAPAVDENRGAAGIYAPPDLGFPDDGVMALGEPDAPGWVRADMDRPALDRVRAEGAVRGRAHAPEAEAAARAVRSLHGAPRPNRA